MLRIVLEGDPDEILAAAARAAALGLSVLSRVLSHPLQGNSMENNAAGSEARTPVSIEEALAQFHRDKEVAGLDPMHLQRCCAFIRECATLYVWAGPQNINSEDIRNAMTAAKKRGNGAKTLNCKRSYLCQFCQFCIDNGYRDEPNPAAAVARAKVIRKVARRVPTPNEVRRIICAAQTDYRKKDRWLVYLTAASSGLRWGTLAELRWSHCKLDADPPHFDLPGHLLKGREPKIVWLTAELADTLKRVKADRAKNPTGIWSNVNSPKKRDSDRRMARIRAGEDLVFLSVPKWEHFRRDIQLASVPVGNEEDPEAPTLTFHSLRHFASNRMKWSGGFSDQERSAQNGHNSVKMTEEVYTDPSHTNLGKKVFGMEKLCPEGISIIPRPPRRLKAGEKNLTLPPHPAEHDAAKGQRETMQKAPPQSCRSGSSGSHASAVPLAAQSSCFTAQSEPPLPGCAPVASEQTGVSKPSIGVSGFEPQPFGEGEDPIEMAMRIAEQTLSVCRRLYASLKAAGQGVPHART